MDLKPSWAAKTGHCGLNGLVALSMKKNGHGQPQSALPSDLGSFRVSADTGKHRYQFKRTCPVMV